MRSPSTGEALTVMLDLPAPGSEPRGLAWDGACLWYVDTKLQALLRLDPDTLRVDRSLPIDADARGLEWHLGALWLADNQAKAVHCIDPRDGRVLTSIRMPADEYLAGTASDGQTLYQASYGGRVYAIDSGSGQILDRRQAGENMCGVAWVNGWLWYTDDVLPALHQIVPDSGQETAQYSLNGDPAGLTWDGTCFWCAEYAAHRILRLHIAKVGLATDLRD